MNWSLVDDIVKFVKDLILGDFEEQPSNAAMIVGGLISLVPIADQLLDVRDVSGMVFRISKKGPKNCTKDDWVDLALAAFGCIPEVGSLFKTIIKPLWKSRKAVAGFLRGSAFIESMLGKHKGKAITFIKTFNWTLQGQLAVTNTMAAMDTCDQFLALLEAPHWWVPNALQGLAHDLRPGLQQSRGPIRTGIAEGTAALREFVTELIGEDGFRVVQQAGTVLAVASTAVPGAAASPTTGRRGGAARAPRPATQQQRPHPPTGGTPTLDRKSGSGPASRVQRSTRSLLTDFAAPFKALIGEHMAHYHHMDLYANGSWPHGRVRGRHADAGWTKPGRLVTEKNRPASPTELVPDHLPRISQNGLDGVWSLGNGVYHFVEAKFSASAGAMFGMGADQWTARKSETAQSNAAAPASPPPAGAKPAKPPKPRKLKLTPPAGLTERQVALWCMLGQPAKGLQMGEEWLRATVDPLMVASNLQNRFIYVFFAVPSTSPPKNYTPAPGGPLKKGVALGAAEHVLAAAEVAQRMITGEDVYDLALHDQHERKHGVSDKFTEKELSVLDDLYKYEKAQRQPASPAGTTGTTGTTSPRTTKPRPPRQQK